MQELSCLGKPTLVPTWSRMMLTQSITWVYKDLALTYPPNISI